MFLTRLKFCSPKGSTRSFPSVFQVSYWLERKNYFSYTFQVENERIVYENFEFLQNSFWFFSISFIEHNIEVILLNFQVTRNQKLNVLLNIKFKKVKCFWMYSFLFLGAITFRIIVLEMKWIWLKFCLWNILLFSFYFSAVFSRAWKMIEDREKLTPRSCWRAI